MRIRYFCGRIRDAAVSDWVLLGFLISYLLFFISPIFFHTNVMQFYHGVPAAEHIGIDLKQTLSFSLNWVTADRPNPVRGNYPPLAGLLFSPLLGLKFPIAFRIVTWISVLAYIVVVLILAPKMSADRPRSSLPAIFCLSGLLSYGFQFELERGQFDAITILLTLLAIWIYHRHSSHRWAAYVLFTLAVQLKLYPLIFVFMFVRDWRDWRNNVRRIFLLMLANGLLLFALGVRVFSSFLNEAAGSIVDPYIWIGSHSIRSAVTLALRLADRHGLSWLDPYSSAIQVILLALTIGCLCLIVLQTWKQNRQGLNPHLLLGLSLGAMLIPTFDHDYRLTILAAPAVVLLLAEAAIDAGGGLTRRALRISVILIFSFAYSSTLFSYVQKPVLLANNFAALFAMLLATTALSSLWSPRPLDAPS